MKRKKKTVSKKKVRKTAKKGATRRKARPVARRAARTRAKKTAPRKAARRKPAAKKPAARKPAARKRAAPPKRARATRRGGSTERPRAIPDEGWRRGMGPEAGGQSGDTEDISRSEIADSESVEELLEEGQSFEAGIVDAVENAPDADEGEIRTREVPEDDVPEEYRDKD